MTFHKQTIRDIHVEGKTVLVRADYNVPLNEKGEISDDLRIRASLPTIQYLLKHNAKVVIISHLGRPHGREEKYSLEPIAHRLAELTGVEVRFSDDCLGDRAYQVAKTAPKSAIILYENLRFYEQEEANDADFARNIAKASGADYFVQDGFGVVHRAHASTDAITQHLPSVAGLLLEKEYVTISDAMATPKRPFVAILGGAKVSDKIKVIEKFVDKADNILIGGAMANTILAYQGKSVGKSKYEKDQSNTLDGLFAAAATKKNENLINLPVDVAVAGSIDANEKRRVVLVDAIEDGDTALDIGGKTIDNYVNILKNAGTVIWNGPVGYAELEEFAHGSARIALELAANRNVKSIVGGGDTADFVLKWSGDDGANFSHVSTGGGAGLDLMAGKTLPGVESLLDARI